MNYEAERLHRPDLARDAPRREFSHYARNLGMGGAPRGAAADPVADGVRLGYSVLDEQMRQGQRLAERLGGARPGAAPLEVGGLVARALDIYRDMGALALAAAEALARNPALGGGLRGAAAPAAPQASPQTPSSAGFALDIQSSRRIGVKLDWRPGERPAAVSLGPLHSAQGGGRPIVEARFDGATLSLKVDDDQPAGTYHGVLVDTASGEAAGTLTVRVPS